jgi:hypothetical protein
MNLAINKTQAAKLLNAAEMDMFNASRAPTIKQLTDTRLTAKVKRARTLRDKFRDLLRRQKLSSRKKTGTKTGTSGSANERTAIKAEIFDDILQRFSKRLEQVHAAAAKEAARQQAAAKKASKTKTAKAKAAKVKTTKTTATKAKVTKAKVTKGKTSKVKPAAKKSVKQTRTASKGAITSKSSPGVRAAAKASRLTAAGTRRIQTHIASAGRRKQARRDGR